MYWNIIWFWILIGCKKLFLCISDVGVRLYRIELKINNYNLNAIDRTHYNTSVPLRIQFQHHYHKLDQNLCTGSIFEAKERNHYVSAMSYIYGVKFIIMFIFPYVIMWILDLLLSSKLKKNQNMKHFKLPPPLSLDVVAYRPQPTPPSLIQSFQPGRKPHFPIRPPPWFQAFVANTPCSVCHTKSPSFYETVSTNANYS